MADFGEGDDGKQEFAVFDVTDCLPMDSREFGKALLCQTSLEAGCFHILPNMAEDLTFSHPSFQTTIVFLLTSNMFDINYCSRKSGRILPKTTTEYSKEKHMIYLCLIFIPPLYFLIRQKWLGFILNSILYGLACLCVASMIGIWIAPFFWILSVGHACFTYRKEASAQHANMVATKMAEKLAETMREGKKS